MRRFALISVLMLGLAACTPADEQYCNGFGVAGTPEFAKCMEYFHRQDEAFRTDRFYCDLEADRTYPPSLYDYGRTEEVIGGFNRGTYYGGQTVRVAPDYRRNAEIDMLRMRIIEPCMQSRGWNSGATWQAGKRAVTPAKPLKPVAAHPLPWLKR